jgi:hypothetical protein
MKRIATVLGAMALGGALIAASSTHAAAFDAASETPVAATEASTTPPTKAAFIRRIFDLEEGAPRVQIGGLPGAQLRDAAADRVLDLDSGATDVPLVARGFPEEAVFAPPCYARLQYLLGVAEPQSASKYIEAVFDLAAP